LHHIVPIIAEVAKEMDLTLIDLHTPFEPYMHLCPDAVHPREDGAAIIAYEFAKVINEKDPKALKRRQKDAIRLARKAAKAVK
jgi:lysophospholipase L1-like esterase